MHPLEAYQHAAEEFRALRPKQELIEGVSQSTQSRITQDSLTVLRRRHPGFTVFGELMIVYDEAGKLKHITPDNAVALVPEDDPRRQSWNWEYEGRSLLVVFDSLARREDYPAALKVYEQLRIPYCVEVDLEAKSVIVRHFNGRLTPMASDPHGRYEIPELNIKLGLFDGWLRFWHQDRLLPIAEEQDEQLEEKDLLIYEQTSEMEEMKQTLREHAALLDQLQTELAGIHERLRLRIDRKARAANRPDILHQLDGSVPIEQLEMWLDELP